MPNTTTTKADIVSKPSAGTGPKPASDPAGETKPPAPFVGYLVVNDDWTPPPKTRTSWVVQLPLMFVDGKDAQAQRKAFAAMVPGEPDGKMIVEATVTFRIVEGGGHG